MNRARSTATNARPVSSPYSSPMLPPYRVRIINRDGQDRQDKAISNLKAQILFILSIPVCQSHMTRPRRETGRVLSEGNFVILYVVARRPTAAATAAARGAA